VLPHLQASALLRLLTIDFPGILGVEFMGALVRHTGSYTCTLYEKGFPWVDKDWNFAQQPFDQIALFRYAGTTS
jgi:hypothetical protein